MQISQAISAPAVAPVRAPELTAPTRPRTPPDLRPIERGYARPGGRPNVVSPDEYLYRPDGRYEWSPARYAAAIGAALRDLERAVRQPWCKRVVLMVGVQGSGKSTYVERQKQPATVYVDDVLETPQMRAAFIAVARAAGVPVEAHWLDEPLEVCIARNQTRPPHRRVNPQVLREVHAQLQRTPPLVSEGLAAVVRLGG